MRELDDKRINFGYEPQGQPLEMSGGIPTGSARSSVCPGFRASSGV